MVMIVANLASFQIKFSQCFICAEVIYCIGLWIEIEMCISCRVSIFLPVAVRTVDVNVLKKVIKKMFNFWDQCLVFIAVDRSIFTEHILLWRSFMSWTILIQFPISKCVCNVKLEANIFNYNQRNIRSLSPECNIDICFVSMNAHWYI